MKNTTKTAKKPARENVDAKAPQWLKQALGGTCASFSPCQGCRTANTASGANLPGQRAIHDLLDQIVAVLFPGCHGRAPVEADDVPDLESHLVRIGVEIADMIERALSLYCKSGATNCENCEDCRESARGITAKFISELPEIRRILQADILAAYEGDPAARSTMEVVMSYPGMYAVAVHRVAHTLHSLGVPLIPRVMSEKAHSATGIDIHPGAKIGEGFFIDHGTGVVIGETCVIGKRVKLYQGVTLGALSFDKDEHGNLIKGVKRHPDVEDNVVIYAGATILGGSTRIGHDSVIGGNVWLIHSVPAFSKVYNQQPSPIIKKV